MTGRLSATSINANSATSILVEIFDIAELSLSVTARNFKERNRLLLPAVLSTH
jgi:hypothetical protein